MQNKFSEFHKSSVTKQLTNKIIVTSGVTLTRTTFKFQMYNNIALFTTIDNKPSYITLQG